MNGLASDVAITTVELAAAGDEVAFARIGLDGRLAIAPDGTVWAAGDAGVAYRRDGRWTIVDPTPAIAIAFDKGGTGWVMGKDGSGAWALEPDGTAWARRAIASASPMSARFAASLGVDGRGELWMGAPDWEGGGLARFNGSRWETLDELGGSLICGATVLGTDPEGAVWIAVTRPVDVSQTEPPPVVTVRVVGEEQTVVEMPAGNLDMGVLLAPDGTLWVATDHGPAEYDGQRWTFPYEVISPSWMGVDRVASDGTVYGSIYGSIGRALLRLPAFMH
jgi:ligand-binding sensor domain-containing protein